MLMWSFSGKTALVGLSPKVTSRVLGTAFTEDRKIALFSSVKPVNTGAAPPALTEAEAHVSQVTGYVPSTEVPQIQS